MSIQDAARQFLEYCEIEKGHSAYTVRNYSHYLESFAAWAAENSIENIEDLSAEQIRQYRLTLARRIDKHGEELSRKTQNYYLIAVRALLKYLAANGHEVIGANRIELADTPERHIEILDEKEIADLLDSPKTKTLAAIRDKAILETLYSTGLRIGELTSLKRKDINLEKGEFAISGKGDKIRIVFLSEDATKALAEYLKKRTDEHPGLFISYGRSKNPLLREESEITSLTPRSIQRMIAKYAISAGITKPVTPHMLRHSFATDLLRNGADLRAVQEMLGHSSVVTTQIYTHVTNPQLKKIHHKFHHRTSTDDA